MAIAGGGLRHLADQCRSSCCSLYVVGNGASAEIAIVGNEGIVGIALFMGANPHPAARSCKARAALFGWVALP